MQSLRDQLLKAGVVTKEQVTQVEAQKRPRRKKPKSRDNGRSKAGQAPNRMVDLSDPILLQIAQAIETNKVLEPTRGEHAFSFALRDGRIRKTFVTTATSKRLESGDLAIVENGAPDQHIIVKASAVAAITTADPEAVRFHNPS